MSRGKQELTRIVQKHIPLNDGLPVGTFIEGFSLHDVFGTRRITLLGPAGVSRLDQHLRELDIMVPDLTFRPTKNGHVAVLEIGTNDRGWPGLPAASSAVFQEQNNGRFGLVAASMKFLPPPGNFPFSPFTAGSEAFCFRVPSDDTDVLVNGKFNTPNRGELFVQYGKSPPGIAMARVSRIDQVEGSNTIGSRDESVEVTLLTPAFFSADQLKKIFENDFRPWEETTHSRVRWPWSIELKRTPVAIKNL